MECFKCGQKNKNSPNIAHCVSCATALLTNCPVCRTLVTSDNVFCVGCGGDIALLSLPIFRRGSGIASGQNLSISHSFQSVKPESLNSTVGAKDFSPDPLDQAPIVSHTPSSAPPNPDAWKLNYVHLAIGVILISALAYFTLSRDSKPEFEADLPRKVKESDVPSSQATRSGKKRAPEAKADGLVQKFAKSIASLSGIDSDLKAMMDAVSQGDPAELNRLAALVISHNSIKKGDKKAARKLNDEGIQSIRAEDYSSAETTFAKALRLDPSDQEIANNYGFALFRLSENRKASEAFQSSLLLNPKRTNAWANFSHVLAKLGQQKEAVDAFMLALTFSKDKTKTLDYLDTFMATDDDEDVRKVAAMIKRNLH